MSQKRKACSRVEMKQKQKKQKHSRGDLIDEIRDKYNNVIMTLRTPHACETDIICFLLQTECGVTYTSGIDKALRTLVKTTGVDTGAVWLLQNEWGRYWRELSNIATIKGRDGVTFQNVFDLNPELAKAYPTWSAGFPRLQHIQDSLRMDMPAARVKSMFSTFSSQSKSSARLRGMMIFVEDQNSFQRENEIGEWNMMSMPPAQHVQREGEGDKSTADLELSFNKHYRERNIEWFTGITHTAVQMVIAEATYTSDEAINILARSGRCDAAEALTRHIGQLQHEIQNQSRGLKAYPYKTRNPSKSAVLEYIDTIISDIDISPQVFEDSDAGELRARVETGLDKSDRDIELVRKTLHTEHWVPLRLIMRELAIYIDVVHGLWENANALVRSPLAQIELSAPELINTIRHYLKTKKKKKNDVVASFLLTISSPEKSMCLFSLSFLTCWVANDILGSLGS